MVYESATTLQEFYTIRWKEEIDDSVQNYPEFKTALDSGKLSWQDPLGCLLETLRFSPDDTIERCLDLERIAQSEEDGVEITSWNLART